MNDSTDLLRQMAGQADQAAERAEQAAARTQRDARHRRGEVEELPGRPRSSVRTPPQSYWSGRQKDELDEFKALLPIIESVVCSIPAPQVPEGLTEEEAVDYALNSRLSTLLRARKLVRERLRKEL